jgi:molybdenum cofactor biosynthesis enzyme MoaA
MLLSHYLDNHNSKLPKGLSTVKVSLDTYDPEEFKRITRGGDLNKIMDGVSRISSQTWVRANTVVLRSNTTPEKIKGLIDFCQSLGMKQVQFLDLVYYSNLPSANPNFWEEQFVGWPEFARVFKQVQPEAKFTELTNQFGVNFHSTKLDNGFIITFKDSTSTMRDPMCATCPLYCQEGRCLVRVATDGNVTFCPDYKAELPHFNGVRTLQDGSFDQKVNEIAKIVESSIRMRTIEIFAKKHNLKLPDEI